VGFATIDVSVTTCPFGSVVTKTVVKTGGIVVITLPPGSVIVITCGVDNVEIGPVSEVTVVLKEGLTVTTDVWIIVTPPGPVRV